MQGPGPGVDCRPVTVGSPDFNGYRNTSDLAMISPAGCPPITTQLVLFSSLIFDKSYFSSLMFDIVLVCRQLPPTRMRVQIFTPTLEPVNPSLKKSPTGIVETDHTDHNILSFDAAETYTFWHYYFPL